MQPAATSNCQRPPGSRRLLIVGGVLSAFNGASHLVLPLIYPWEQHTGGLYEPVRWALYASTIFFGLLLLWGGLLVAVLARRSDVPPQVQRWVFGGLAAFWVAGGVYEVLVPFPAPVADLLLPTFSFGVAGLLGAGLIAGSSEGETDEKHRQRLRRRRPWPARRSEARGLSPESGRSSDLA